MRKGEEKNNQVLKASALCFDIPTP